MSPEIRLSYCLNIALCLILFFAKDILPRDLFSIYATGSIVFAFINLFRLK